MEERVRLKTRQACSGRPCLPLQVSHRLLPSPCRLPSLSSLFPGSNPWAASHGILLTSRLIGVLGDTLVQRSALRMGRSRRRAAALPLGCHGLRAPALSCLAVLSFLALPFSGDLCRSCGTARIAQQRPDQGAHLSTVWFSSSSSSFVISHLLSSSKARSAIDSCLVSMCVNVLQRQIVLYLVAI